VRVRPGERFDLDLDLSPGTYLLCGAQLGWSLEFQVRPGVVANRWEFSLSTGPADGLDPALGINGQVLTLNNDSEHELLIRVERVTPRDDALTAARASTLAVFRELFPSEALAPGRLVNVSNVTLLVTALDQARTIYEELGDARAFAVLHEHFRLIDEVVRREGGAIVKTIGEGVLAVFHAPELAVRAALDLPPALASGESTGKLRLRAAIHRGPAMAATLNDQLDYFGTTVYETAQALARGRANLLVLTRAVSADPAVAAYLADRGMPGALLDDDRRDAAFGPLLGLALSIPSETTLSGTIDGR
jgi:class 3 adenylate cyclase